MGSLSNYGFVHLNPNERPGFQLNEHNGKNIYICPSFHYEGTSASGGHTLADRLIDRERGHKLLMSELQREPSNEFSPPLLNPECCRISEKIKLSSM
ncbi:4834_t:CDS:2 [Ambispora gerdemannii]|uniref:4834_t:CDS:1 n=1 Tax=Ambispora gerdemannii TaxID=144530 RepID=A0A9N8ZXP9_9GLOM|nr:4834_t:CDS:2 [Ambispora gerdemannii]